MITPRTLVARFTAREGQDILLEKLLVELECAVVKDPGTLTFRAFRDENGRGFTVWEQYESQEAFEKHIAMEHVVLFNKRLSPLIEEQESKLEFMNPVSAPTSKSVHSSPVVD